MSLSELKKAHKQEKDLIVSKRISVLYAYYIKIEKLKMSRIKARETLVLEADVSRRTINNYINRYKENKVDGLRDLPRSGAPHTYPPEIVDRAITELEKEGRLTARLLAARVQKLL